MLLRLLKVKASMSSAHNVDNFYRILAAWYKFAEFKNPGFGMPINFTNPHEFVNARDPASRSTIFQGAVEGHVLVKNVNNALPLKKPRFISLFGYDAYSPLVNTAQFFYPSKWNFGMQSVGQVSDELVTEFVAVPELFTPDQLPEIAMNGTRK